MFLTVSSSVQFVVERRPTSSVRWTPNPPVHGSTIYSRTATDLAGYWIDRGVLGMNGVIGCFAMTELAHGSNVAGLETTATFDPASDEFVIHTPHLGATKWWIGGAASTATHAAVFAQMVIDGKKKGVKTFVTQLRDTK